MNMKKHNQDGAVNTLLLPLILAIVFFFGSLGFGYWAFSERQDYKDNSDQKVAVAVKAAKQAEAAKKDLQYAEAAKLPNKTYTGPEQYGSIVLLYPKTWSAYVDASGKGTAALDGYFNPDVVPATDDNANTFALRVKVINQSYSSVLSGFQSRKQTTITPYSLPKVPQVVGVKVVGQIDDKKQGTMVILPVRDKTLEISTEVANFQADYDNIILPNVTFAP